MNMRACRSEQLPQAFCFTAIFGVLLNLECGLIWSAVTCHRFGIRRPVAVVFRLNTFHHRLRLVAAYLKR
jgi:hypothetical protein